jgi:hypothetical protein
MVSRPLVVEDAAGELIPALRGILARPPYQRIDRAEEEP